MGVTLPGPPTSALHAATKAYVDAVPITTLSSPANAGTLTIDASTTARSNAIYRVTPGVAGFTLAAPSNPADGQQVNVEIAPTVTFSLTISGPLLTTGITSPVAIASGKKGFFGLRYSGSSWYLIAATVQS